MSTGTLIFQLESVRITGSPPPEASVPASTCSRRHPEVARLGDVGLRVGRVALDSRPVVGRSPKGLNLQQRRLSPSSGSWCGVAKKKSRLRSTTAEEEVIYESRSSDRAADRAEKTTMGRLVRSIAQLSPKQRAKVGLDEQLMAQIERLAGMPVKSAYGRQVRTITSEMRRLGLDEKQLQAAYDRGRGAGRG